MVLHLVGGGPRANSPHLAVADPETAEPCALIHVAAMPAVQPAIRTSGSCSPVPAGLQTLSRLKLLPLQRVAPPLILANRSGSFQR